MQKRIILLTAIFFLIGGLAFNSCDKDQNSPVEPDLEKTTTLKGIVYANLSERNDTLPQLPGGGIQWENAPEGTLIQVRIDATQYSANADGYFLHSTTVKSDGTYSIEIPSTIQGVTAEIIPTDFEYDKVVGNWIWDGSSYVWEGTTQRTVYSANIIVVTGMVPNGVKFQDINYN